MKDIKGILVVLIILFIAASGILLSGCRNIKEWKTVKTIDHLKKIETIETYYKTDTGFDLGTEGLGEYNAVKLETSVIDK